MTRVEGGGHVRVVVVGAGIIGLATARALALRGAQVVVLERGMAAQGTSSRGEGNMLVSDKAIPAEAALALRSLDLWRDFAATSAEPFEYEAKGGIVTASSAAQLRLLTAQADRQRTLGIVSTVLDADAVHALEPGLSPQVAGGVHYPQDAQVMPIHAVRALQRAATDLGVVVRTGAGVTGMARRGDGLRVQTSDGNVDVDAVVNAAGPWGGEVAAVLGGTAAVFPRRGLLLVTEPLPPGTVRHKIYDGAYVEAVASDEADAKVAVVVESTPSGTILIGSTREAVGWAEEVPWDLAGRLAGLAVGLFPALGAAQVIRTYQGFRPATRDHLPLIGPDGEVAGLFHHTGHEGAGIGLALASAELLADAVLEGVVDAAFDPRRLGVRRIPDVGAPEGDGADGAGPRPDGVCRIPDVWAPEDDRAGRDAAAPPPPPSLAAAWLGAGRQAFRRTRFADQPRGLFCGIGHCWDCVVVDDAGQRVRACLEPA